MSRNRCRALLSAGVIAVGVGVLTGLPATAQAAPAHPTDQAAVAVDSAVVARNVSCGYDGYDGSNGNQPLYNHCGAGGVVIEVDHFFWQTTYACMPPGVHEIPQGDSQWRIIGAEYDGHTCNSRYPISIVGP